MDTPLRKNIVLKEGVDQFPENEEVLKAKPQRMRELLILEENEHYHGPRRVECLLVKFRLEKTYDGHYLDIYKCLVHDRETCRCGREWGKHFTHEE